MTQKNIVTRKSVFETNSSSCHSITIDNDQFVKCNTLEINSSGQCCISCGEFGWEQEDFDDANTKASYCLTYVQSLNCDTIYYMEMLKKVIEKVVKVPVVFQLDDEYEENGYIDHQSMDVCQEVFDSEAKLHNFIFNQKSILTTDNDNH